MQIVVAGDKDDSTAMLQQWLSNHVLAADVHTVPLSGLANQTPRLRPKAILLILSLTDGVEKALDIVRDIRDTVPTRILVVGPIVDPKWMLQLLREGVFQYIVQDDISTELGEALGRLDRKSPSDKKFGNLIAVVGASGGCGVSTLAASMAVGLCQNDERCGLIDLRMASGDLASLLGVQPSFTLADFCRNLNRMDHKMFHQCLETHESGVQLLASPNSYRDVRTVTSRGIRKALGLARSEFDFVVVDLECSFDLERSIPLLQADAFLLVMRLDIGSVRRAQQLLEFFADLELDLDSVSLTVGLGGPEDLRIADVEKTLGMRVSFVVPDDSRRATRAINRGRPLILDSPRTAVARRITEISRHVMELRS